jgi:crotonobetainyl-CoA:carnitine CoA-transferase CaiB-like acyl-CoA transferase
MTDSNAGLDGLTVVDLGVGMAAALIAKFLREAGAEVTRIEPGGGDPFYQVYPAYAVWRRGQTNASPPIHASDLTSCC